MDRYKKARVLFILSFVTMGILVFLIALDKSDNIIEAFYERFQDGEWSNPLDSEGLEEDLNIYGKDDPTQIQLLYLTITENRENPIEWLNEFESGNKLEVFLHSGGKGVFEMELHRRDPNATIEVRKRTYDDLLKSYKIRPYASYGLWNKQNVINLDKNYRDSLRIRNKLSFDYLQLIPDMTSLRTSFVRLFIQDNSYEDEVIYDDYGFFTQVEQTNGLYLENHKLDPNGILYEAKDFDFSLRSDVLKTKDHESYLESDFESVLELKENDNHEKLIEMLEAVNDEDQDIDLVVEKYFQKDNYLTWVAVNILFDNFKTMKSDYILYSPMNSEKWYFMPLNYDKAWGDENLRPQWQKGLFMYWESPLHKRFFRKPANVEALSQKIDELTLIINPEQTRDFLDRYYEIVFANLTKNPDFKYLALPYDSFEKLYDALPEITAQNRNYYYSSLEKPTPFSLIGKMSYDEGVRFQWKPSYDLQGDNITYSFEISRSPTFDELRYQYHGIEDTFVVMRSLEMGIYYWRVTAVDDKGNEMKPMDNYIDNFGDEFYGMQQITME